MTETPSGLLRPTTTKRWTLTELLADQRHALAGASASDDVILTGLSLDSRNIHPGEMYVGLPGANHHGARFSLSAIEAGASAVLTDAAGAGLLVDAFGTGLAPETVPVVIVEDPRHAMAELAAKFYGDPTDELMMFGVTGTNGKTTTAFIIEAGLRAAGLSAGTIGTIGYRVDGVELKSGRTTVTTPESPDLQALLALMQERGVDAVAMEVSSHALELERVTACRFDVVGFTNLGRDHLDFHHTLEDYFQAKAKLFVPDRARHAVVVIDDEAGERLASQIKAAGAPQLTTVGRHEQADVRIRSVDPAADSGSRVTAKLGERELTFTIALPGDYNAANTVLALAMLDAAGVDVDAALPGLESAQVPGRMQLVDLGEGAPRVLVDFAHTPQAISQALAALVVPGQSSVSRIIAVVGAGGDRDATKRPLMGEASARGADIVIVTDDNPRTENPADIRAQVLEGAKAVVADKPSVQIRERQDRRAAIAEALMLAGPSDTVIVLGKGHETGQQVAGRVFAFDDARVVREQWEGLRPESPAEEPRNS